MSFSQFRFSDIWKFSAVLLAFSVPVFIHEAKADNGGDSSGGGYSYDQADKLLDKAVQEILVDVDTERYASVSPENRALMKDVIRRVDRKKKKSLNRDDKELRYNYVLADEATGSEAKIEVLKDFYTGYMGTSPEAYKIDLPQVKRDLIHEMSHLWGLGVGKPGSENDDRASAEFAESIYPKVGEATRVVILFDSNSKSESYLKYLRQHYDSITEDINKCYQYRVNSVRFRSCYIRVVERTAMDACEADEFVVLGTCRLEDSGAKGSGVDWQGHYVVNYRAIVRGIRYEVDGKPVKPYEALR